MKTTQGTSAHTFMQEEIYLSVYIVSLDQLLNKCSISRAQAGTKI